MNGEKKYTRYLIIAFAAVFLGNLILQTAMYRSGIDHDIIVGDGRGYYAYLHSLFFDGDLDFRNQYSRMYDDLSLWSILPTETGQLGNVYAVGTAILWTPLFLAAHSLTLLLNLFGLSLPADGYSVLYQYFIVLGSLLYGFAGLWVLFRWLSRTFSVRSSCWSVLLTWLAGSLLNYSLIQSGESHIFSVISVTFFYVLYFKFYPELTIKRYALLGTAAGLMTLVRWQNAMHSVLLLLPVIDALFNSREKTFRTIVNHLPGILLFGLVSGIVCIPQMAAWKVIYGKYILIPQSYGADNSYLYGRFTPHVFEFLFSTHHGMITWTPIVFFCLTGLVLFFFRNKPVGLVFLLSFLIQLYVCSSTDDWAAGDSFGARRILNTVPLLAFGLAQLLEYLYPVRWKLVRVIGTILIAWNFIFVIQYKLNIIPNHGPLTFQQLVTSKFTFPVDVFHKVQEYLN